MGVRRKRLPQWLTDAVEGVRGELLAVVGSASEYELAAMFARALRRGDEQGLVWLEQSLEEIGEAFMHAAERLRHAREYWVAMERDQSRLRDRPSGGT